jgi:uncharacterized RDD family membrane protein YckC
MGDVNVQSQTQYVGFWKRLLIYVVDVIIMAIPLLYLYRLSTNLSLELHSVIPLIFKWVLLFAFIIFMTVKFGGTPGKLLFKTRIVNRDGNYLSIINAIFRSSILILNGIVQVAIEIEGLYSYENNILDQVSEYVGLLFIIDALIILTNRNKRALHDLIAGSFVVAKQKNLTS